MYKKRGYRRKPAIRAPLRAGRRAAVMNRKAKVATVDAVARQVKRIRTEMKRSTEVKEYTPNKSDLGSMLVGQVNVNNSGTDSDQFIICTTQQGSGADQRIGNKTRLIGIALRFYISQQSATSVASTLIFDVYKTTDFGYTLLTIQDLIYDVDSMSGVREGHSSRNRDWIKSKSNPNGLFQLVASKRVRMQPDTQSGQLMYKDFKMFIKQKQDLHYNGSAAQEPANVKYIMFVRSTVGNIGGVVSTLTGVPVSSASTGFDVKWRHTSYYIDN